MKLHPIQNRERVFLTAPEVPPNLLRLKPGDVIVPTSEHVRQVVRVGYRLHAREIKGEATALLNTPEGRRLALDMQTMCGACVELEGVVARALVQARRFGGPERGIVADVRALCGAAVVRGTRCVQLGTYYPGGGGWSHGPDGSEYDYDNGGLSHPRTVVLVRTYEYGEVISGDFRRST